MTDWQGKKHNYITKTAAMASNRYIHDEIMEAVA